MKELFIDKGVAQSRVCIIEDGKAIELYVENHDNKNMSGNIYLGRIENIVESLNAAFVNIGIGKNAILHFEDCTSKELLKRGNQILVQVVRESSGNKGPRVSTKLSLPGRNIVFLPEINYIGISKKILSEELRKSLRRIAREIIQDDGIIIRTEAEFEELESIREEYDYLRNKWNHIKSIIKYIKAPKLVFDSRDFFDFLVREFVKHDIDRIIINNSSTYNMLQSALADDKKEFMNIVELNEYDFGKINFIKKEILGLFDDKISLELGSFIIINESEALVSIDVNSGSFIKELTHQDTSLKVNLDACMEIAKIIRLRNLSGIIIIDFIDMATEEERNRIIEELDLNLKKDKTSSRIYGFTKLGLLEMTRSRKGKRTLELIYDNYNEKSFNTSFLLKEIENECAMISRHKKKNTIDVLVNNKIMLEINSSHFNYVSEVKELYGIDINFICDKNINNYLVDKRIEEIKNVKIELLDKTISGTLEYLHEEDNSLTVKIYKG